MAAVNAGSDPLPTYDEWLAQLAEIEEQIAKVYAMRDGMTACADALNTLHWNVCRRGYDVSRAAH